MSLARNILVEGMPVPDIRLVSQNDSESRRRIRDEYKDEPAAGKPMTQ